jgi:hypothetical protein
MVVEFRVTDVAQRSRAVHSIATAAGQRRVPSHPDLHVRQLADRIAARMTRIRLETADLALSGWIPGQQVRVVVGDAPAPKNWILGQMRTYSVWQFTPDWLDLAVLDHGSPAPACPPG